MYCKQCGNLLKDTDQFCWACGADMPTAAPAANESAAQEAPVNPVYAQPVWTPPVQASAKKKEKKPGKKWVPFAVIGGAVAAIAAIVLTLFFTGVFDSDSVRVFKAIGRTGKAFEASGEALGMPDLQYIQEEKAYSLEFGFVLNELRGYEEFCGLGISAAMNYSLPGKKLGMSLVPSYGSMDILNVEMKVDDDMFYLGAPEITGKTFYSVNTETLIADLANLGGDMEGFEDVRINLFELMQIIDENMMYSKEDQEKIGEAVVELLKSIEAEKVGSEEISVNGNDVECDEYEVVVKKEALMDFFEGLVDVAMNKDMTVLINEICKSLNLPKELVNQMTGSLQSLDTEDLLDSMEDALDEFGDIEMTFYLDDGYVMAIVYEIEVEGSEIEFEVNIGGGDNYVDDLSVSMSANGTTMKLESTGNHTGKNGKFTDETKLYVKNANMKQTILTSSMTFDSKKSGDNFQWTMDMEEMAGLVIDVSGNVSYDSKSMTMDLDEVSFSQYGDDMIAFSLYYKLGKYTDNIKVNKSVELLKLSENEIMEEFEKLSGNIEEWAMGLAEKAPELLELIL